MESSRIKQFISEINRIMPSVEKGVFEARYSLKQKRVNVSLRIDKKVMSKLYVSNSAIECCNSQDLAMSSARVLVQKYRLKKQG